MKYNHLWARCGNGEPDVFAYESDCGYHNGPRCAICGYSFCQHCNPQGWETSCSGRDERDIHDPIEEEES